MTETNATRAAGSSAPACSTCITDFLKTKRSKEELKIALSVVREFKSCESLEEWAGIFFAAWAKLEQLQEFLEHLCEDKPLADDTKAYIKRMSNTTAQERREAAYPDADGSQEDRR